MTSRPQHNYYVVTWIVIAAITVWGFGPTFFLRGLVSADSLPLVLRLHGLVMTAWLGLFLLQVSLAATGRVIWHRRLGTVGIVMGVTVIVATLAATRRAAHLGEGPPGVPTELFVLASLLAALAFAMFFAAAIALRRRPDWHQRLMLLATLTLLGAGVSRLPYDHLPASEFLRSGGPYGLFTIDLLVTYCCVAWDTVRNRRLHPAFGFGLPMFLILNNLLVIIAAGSTWWHKAFGALAA